MKEEDKEYCTDCDGEVAVRLEDCPAYTEKLRKELKEEKK